MMDMVDDRLRWRGIKTVVNGLLLPAVKIILQRFQKSVPRGQMLHPKCLCQLDVVEKVEHSASASGSGAKQKPDADGVHRPALGVRVAPLTPQTKSRKSGIITPWRWQPRIASVSLIAMPSRYRLATAMEPDPDHSPGFRALAQMYIRKARPSAYQPSICWQTPPAKSRRSSHPLRI